MTVRNHNQRPWPGPFGLGWQGYLIALIIILAPLILALVITALAGQPLTHRGPHLP